MSIHTSAVQLPILDLLRFNASPESRTEFVADLRRVLHDHGFFYLVGHGVPPELIADVFAAAKRFFALPEKDKLEIEMVNSPHFRGYNRAGLEHTRGKQDWREQIDVNTESEAVELAADTPAWKRLIGPNQWPSALPELKPLLLRYQAEVTRVSIDILKAIGIALGQDENVFAALYEPQPTQLLKIVRYPGRDAAESEQGVGAHKDGGLVTVLLQDTTPGLRVRTEEGVWLEAPPLPGSLVINTGELLELATNGYVKADVHDVVTPPAGSERFSVPFFLGARYDAVVPVIQLPDELSRKERGITVDPLNPIFREVGQNNLKSRLRSHPDVAQRHHADLL
ncbi:2-oxoglutarate-dependent ethylene/succinate-forming enzyme [Agrobacterium sp. DSM 25558]|uniref:isopenicillin N synthase family dioxygenase n=1 Tax=Agrobacterium sp. DSM 25558 TaxID=1907665 RepID=UPI000972453C|nr:2-oxoglutarate and iron-dependent oxygenase domain-containing protein [Agrobacterium sp. DSM 25558]SCX22490.1 2-oxoglutarate-dependent ethylene/succinate-forming enzyme [Agrobacterium sp. DSM 25558]